MPMNGTANWFSLQRVSGEYMGLIGVVFYHVTCNIEYGLKYQFIGVVLHLQSGCVLCLKCRKGILIESILGHLQSTHQLNRFIQQYNANRQESEKLKAGDIEFDLREIGAKSFTEHGLYTAPLRAPLPVIRLLPVTSGFVCGYCPVQDYTSTSKFTSTKRSMENHIYRIHPGQESNNYASCFVQYLYNDQAHKVYFAVERAYSGPRIESTITLEGERLFEQFMQQNEDYHQTFNPNDTVEDSRLYSRFFAQVNWFGLVSQIAGENSSQARISLYKWVNNIVEDPTPEIMEFNLRLKLLVRHYFDFMQEKLCDSSTSMYLYRLEVKHTDP